MLGLSVLLLATVVATCAAAPIVVDIGGTGDYTAIQPALDAAAEGDTVLVMPGTYTGVDNTYLDFAGTNVVLQGEAGAAVTIIDCEEGRSTRAFTFLEDDAGPSCVIEGLTLTNGGNYAPGGLVYCWMSSPTFVDCVFSNSVGTYGGALYICESTASFTRCVFTGNSADHGGAAQVELASPTFVDCEFTLNTSTGEAGGVDVIWDASPTFTRCEFSQNSCATDGGGIRCYDNSSPTLIDCDFDWNTASRFGGGAFCDSTSSPVMTDCTFQSNSAGNSGGGACLRGDSAPSFIGCLFSNNDCIYGGGGADVEESSATFESCEFWDNSAKWGGGAYCYPLTASFTDCVFLSNSATGPDSNGGGVVCDSGACEFTNCTFVGNSTEDEGGGSIHCWNADPVLANCIIAFTEGGPAVGCEAGTESPTLTCCVLYSNPVGSWVGCISGQEGSGGNMTADPMFCDRPGGDLTIDAASPCAPANSGGCGLIGALDVGCDSPVRSKTWGAIKSMYR